MLSQDAVPGVPFFGGGSPAASDGRRRCSFALLRTGLAGAIVLVLADRRVGSQAFEPPLVIRVETSFNIVDQKNTITVACRLCSQPICIVLDWGD